MKKLFYILVFLVFAAFAFTLNLSNPETISIKYYFGISLDLPVFIVLMAPFFIGMVLGVLIMSLSVFKNKRQVGVAKKALSKVEKEVQNLRAMPIKDDV
jgi:Protein of unknown function (DUF1049).